MTSLSTREPGGTWLGERIREVLLARTGAGGRSDPLTDAFLFDAARRQLVTEVLRPALAAGRTVVCARYADSTLAYQGYGAGVPIDDLRALQAVRDRRPPPGPDAPARPAGRGRPGAQVARRGHPVRGRVRPRLPRRVRAGFLALAGRGTRALRRHRRDAAVRGRRGAIMAAVATGCRPRGRRAPSRRVRVNRRPPPLRIPTMTDDRTAPGRAASHRGGRRGPGRPRPDRRRSISRRSKSCTTDTGPWPTRSRFRITADAAAGRGRRPGRLPRRVAECRPLRARAGAA